MHVVVNHLYVESPVSETALMALEFEALPACRAIPASSPRSS